MKRKTQKTQRKPEAGAESVDIVDLTILQTIYPLCICCVVASQLSLIDQLLHSHLQLLIFLCSPLIKLPDHSHFSFPI